MSMHNAIHLCAGNTVSLSYVGLLPARPRKRHDLFRNGSGQGRRDTALTVAIRHVVSIRSEKQMTRVHAFGIVAAVKYL